MKKRFVLILLVFIIVMTIFPTASLADSFENYDYIDNGDGTCTIISYTGWESDVVIPSNINGLLVTGIGDSAFNNNYALTTVLIPNSVTIIGDAAFYCCSSLVNVTIPESVTSIGFAAFASCSSLTNVMLPSSVMNIGEYAFNYCYSLTDIIVAEGNENYSSIDGVLFNKAAAELIQYPIGNTRTSYTVPNSVIIIGLASFNGCENLLQVTLQSNVTTIGYEAFLNCLNLESIIIPDSVTTIGPASLNCTNLTSVIIPESVTSIGHQAFEGSPLISIEIPSSVTSIGDYAFSMCASLQKVTILSETVTFGEWVFAYTDLVTDGIYGYAGSTTETYANEYSLPFHEIAVVEGEVPGQVQNLQAETYPYAVRLSWDPVPDAEFYRIPCDMEPIETIETYAWIRDIRPEQEYTFYVQAVNTSGDGASTSITVTTPMLMSMIPSPISDLEVTSVGQEIVQLRFTPVNDAEEFYVEWSTDSDFTNYWQYGVQKTEAQDYAYISLSTGEPEYELPPETICFFRVWAKNYGPEMDSEPYLTSSNIVSALTGDATALPQGQLSWFVPPDSILGENEYIAGPNSVTTCIFGGVMPRNVTGASGYRIYYSTTSDPIAEGTYAEFTMFTSDYAFCTVTGLDPQTTYNLQIVPFNHLGEGTPSEILEVTTTEDLKPGQVQNVQATAYLCAIHLTWDPVENATSYKIPGMDDIITEDTSAWIYGFYPDSFCEFRVIACNSFGEGVPSETLTIETASFATYPQYPSKVTSFEILETTSGDLYSTAKIRFEKVTDAMQYRLKVSTNSDMSDARYEYIGSSIDRVYECERDFFAPETTYYMQIIASNFVSVEMDDIYWDTPSDPISFTTPDPKYSVAEQTSAVFRDEYFEVGTDRATLAWTLIDDASGTEWGNVSKFKLFYSETPTGINDEGCQYIYVGVSAWILETYEITGLNPLTTYYFKLLPFNTLGAGTFSDVVSITTLAPEGIPTQEGTDINILDFVTGASLSFDNVATSGLTTVEQLESPPDDTYFYFEESCGYYDINTTASFDGAVRITLPYDPDLLSGPESGLRLYQIKDGEQPIDITESIDTENNTITGIVTDHFCVFTIGIPVQHTVTFDSKGGSLLSSVAVNYNTAVPAPDEPTKSGYKFDAWYKDEECTVKWNFTLDKVTENITLYAKWLYDFTGFFRPIDMNDVLNVVKAGSSIPIKFSLGGDMGLDVFEEGYPKVYNYYAQDEQIDDDIEIIAFSNSGLTYDPVSDQYTYVWKTDKEWSGVCKQLFIRFNDGTLKVIYFKFK